MFFSFENIVKLKTVPYYNIHNLTLNTKVSNDEKKNQLYSHRLIHQVIALKLHYS